MKTPPSVAIIYHFVPHYRIGFVKALANSDKFSDYHWFSSPLAMEGIPAISADQMGNFTPIKNIWIRGMLFQPYVLWLALIGAYDSYVFLANPNFITTWVAALIIKLRGKNVIFWGHGFFSDEKNLKNKIRQVFFSIANCSYVYGYRAKKQAINIGFSRKKIHVGFNSLDYSLQLELRKSLDSEVAQSKLVNSPQKIRVLAISRLTAICEYDTLLRAVDIAQRTSPSKFKVVFVGDGPERTNLECLARNLGLDVEFLGAIYDEKITSKLIREADCVAQPGKIGLTAMHALMFGTPVISHSSFQYQMPEVEALIDGITGMLHSRGDANDLARCLANFSNCFPDRLKTRRACYRVMDEIYNPSRQIEVLAHAASGADAVEGNLMEKLFL
jgi:glycosyltransferase involved in cell wall biosynthesis